MGTVYGGGYADTVEIADTYEFVDVEAGAMSAQTELGTFVGKQHGSGKRVSQALDGVGY